MVDHTLKHAMIHQKLKRGSVLKTLTGPQKQQWSRAFPIPGHSRIKMWAGDNQRPWKSAVKQPKAAALDQETLVGSWTAVLLSCASPDGICLLTTLLYLNVSEKGRPATKTQRSRGMAAESKVGDVLSTQVLTQCSQKMLVSRGKGLGSNNRIVEHVWQVLWQAKLHQPVFILSMEDDKDARWFEVGGMMGSETERGRWKKREFC